MLSLGVLNAVLNILVFVLADFVTKLGSHSIHDLLLLDLQRHGRVPILVESGGIRERFKRKLIRLRHFRSPTKLAIIFLSTVLFILFEIAAESGVDISYRCRPYPVFSKDGICAGACSGDKSGVKNIESAVATQKTKWDCDSLVKTPLRQGFRKNFTGDEAFRPERKHISDLQPIIANGCSVHSFKLIPTNSTKMWFRKHTNIFTLQWTEMELPGSVKPMGMGDFVGNNKASNAFFVRRPIRHGDGRIAAEFFDYADQPSLMQGVLYDFILKRKPVSEILNSAPILSYTISCAYSDISPEDFQRALFVYRTIQIETRQTYHPVEDVIVGNSSTKAARPFTPCDVMKAVIAMKSVCRESCEGKTAVYSTCGTYDLQKFVPLLGSVLTLIAIAIVAAGEVQRRKAFVSIPNSEQQWSCLVAKNFKRQERQEGGADSDDDYSITEHDMINMEFVTELSGDNTDTLSFKRR